jgi:hypothetical protein
MAEDRAAGYSLLLKGGFTWVSFKEGEPSGAQAYVVSVPAQDPDETKPVTEAFMACLGGARQAWPLEVLDGGT